MVLLTDVVSRFNTFSEALHLAQKCGTRFVINHTKVVVSQPNLGCYTSLCGFLGVV
jgi:hypothetical protein